VHRYRGWQEDKNLKFMARISFFRTRLPLATIQTIKSKKLLFTINLGIFISIFALTSSIFSIFFENKIEKIETKIIKEETNQIIYNNWTLKVPNRVISIQKFVNESSRISNYQNFIAKVDISGKTKNQKIIGPKERIYWVYYDYENLADINLNFLENAAADALVLSNDEEDLEKIIFIRNKLKEFADKIITIKGSHYDYEINFYKNYDMKNILKKFDLYEKHEVLKKKLFTVITEQNNFIGKEILNFFSNHRNESQNKIYNLHQEIEKYSKYESQLILLAFVIQFVIFMVIQFFEVTFESRERAIRRKK